jgi:transposase InsO family protein
VAQAPSAGPACAALASCRQRLGQDFAEAPAPIDGCYSYLLAVRDLASGHQLLWQPLTAPTADTILALGSLFARHGPPLVLKTDNGSPFSAGDTLAFLHQAQVIPLFSPPRTPRYNGAIEAGIGSLKTRTECHALRHGRSAWTWDDVEAARLEANATARPHGSYGPTPDDLWLNRPALTSLERALFQATLHRLRREVRIHEGYSTEGPLPVRDDRAVERHAIRRALVEHGYLLFSRRRLPLSFTNNKVTDIT